MMKLLNPRMLGWLIVIWVASTMGSGSLSACTLFVLQDENRVLFANNEDWSNPRTQIWFRGPKYEKRGRVYVGFDDGWAQGGMNDQGLAFDWVAGFKEEWKVDPERITPERNPCELMLEQCSTVGEAVAFFEKHNEPSFAHAKIMVADASGVSAIIGFRDGKLHVQPSEGGQTFGFGRHTANTKIQADPSATPANAFAILKACRQQGSTPTRYSSVFDLSRRDIYILSVNEETRPVVMSLQDELEKGDHSYEIPRLRKQLHAPNSVRGGMKSRWWQFWKK